MTGEIRYWGNWSEEQLAAFQQNQGNSNHCAKYAAATVLNLLYDQTITGEAIVSWLSEKFLDGTPRYTILGDTFGSLVVQTAAIVREVARQHHLHPQVSIRRSSREDLLNSLLDPNRLEIVSITYLKHNHPRISYGRSLRSSLGAPGFFGGHLMVLGAYDDTHLDEMDQPTPWGFLSSWARHEQLYWMPEDDFLHSWGRYSPFRNVTVARS